MGAATPRTLPVTAQALEDGACCGACAAERDRARRTDSEPLSVAPKRPQSVSREAHLVPAIGPGDLVAHAAQQPQAIPVALSGGG